MCTHLLLEAEGLADEVVVPDRGRILAAGSPEHITRRDWLAARVLLDADDPTLLDRAEGLPFVRSYSRNGAADALVGAGARLRRVEPQTPTLGQLYFAIRQGVDA
jgi:ABC-type multidrug transport system ATPase subunit